MKESSLAKRYAAGLIKTLTSEKEYREIKKELETFREVLNSIEEFKTGMGTLLFSKSQKKEILDTLHQKIKLNKKTYQFLWTILEENRLMVLDSIILMLEDLWFEKNGIEKLKVYSAVPLGPTQEKKLIENLEAAFKKRIVIEKEIDPSLLAGIKVRKGHVFYDFSIEGNLKKLKEALVAGDSFIEMSAVVSRD
ncbi:MAG: ATP synthase F1 subunit delta [Candidatus Aminicenantes bacterium]|nr:MAG: ATP synthase F1 subunit delta [Candidatus Aminicenantes bacterium]